jgi:hypothetical protein
MKIIREDDGSVNMYSEYDQGAGTSGWPYALANTGGPIKADPYATQAGAKHYLGMAIQPHEYIVKNNIGWSAGNAIKYLSRYKLKGGAEDVRKAIHYCQLLLKEEFGE